MLHLTLDQVVISARLADISQPLSLHLQGGELLQIIGRNGAGKSTLLSTMAGLLPPEQGDILWCGKNIDDTPHLYATSLFYLGHKTAIKPQLTVLENMLYAYPLIHIDHSSALSALNTSGLHSSRYTPAGALSRGQQQRLALTLLHCSDAALLLLDEPFTALDVHSSQWLIELLHNKLKKGCLIVLTAHQRLSINDIKSHYYEL